MYMHKKAAKFGNHTNKKVRRGECEQMKIMRRVRQTVTVLLSAAMLMTSIPQTGAVALAAEEEAALEDTGSSADVQNTGDIIPSDGQGDIGKENPDTDTPDGNGGQGDSVNDLEKEGEDGDTQPGSSEDGETADDEDISDTPDEDQDEIPDGDQDVENDEETETGEGSDDITDVPEEIITADESISANTLDKMSEQVEVLTENEVPEYVGDVSGDFIQIDVGCVEAESRVEGIVEILEYYAKQGKKFHQFYISSLDCDSELAKDGKMVISARIVNAAVKIWAGEYGYIGFQTGSSMLNTDVEYDFVLPHTIKEDVTIETTTTLLQNQGMKMQLSVNATEFPGKYIQFRWGKEGDGYYKYFGQEECDLGVLQLESGEPTAVVKDTSGWYAEFTWEGGDGSSGDGRDVIVNFDDPSVVQPNVEYLITPLYDDTAIYEEEFVSVNTTRELKAGIRSGSDEITSVKWKSMNPKVVTIDEEGILTAVSPGEAYYYVTYTCEENKYCELHRVKTAAITDSGDALEYVGEVDGEVYGEDEDAYSSLWIDANRNGKRLTTNDIVAILQYYAYKNQKFTDISINGLDGRKGQTIPATVANAARSILRYNDQEHLTFDYDTTDGTVMYDLTGPYHFDKDIKLNYTETFIVNQGVKIKLATSDVKIPAEYVLCKVDWNSSKKESLSNSLGDEERDAYDGWRMFKLNSGNPSAGMGKFVTLYDHLDASIVFGDVNIMQFNAEYLLTPIYGDDAVQVGTVEQLTAGNRSESSNVSSVTWKSLDTDTISIDSKGMMTAWQPGEAYYYVKYKSGKDNYLEVHRVEITQQDVSIIFDENEIAMEVRDDDEEKEQRYLRLRFTPSDAECDPGNPDEILWETSDPNVVSLVKYNEQGEEDAAGNPNGTIRAVGAGGATITASYLRDTDGDGTKEKIASATCTVKVTKALTWEDVREQVESLDLYAVTNLDTKLSDIVIQKDGQPLEGWAWQTPDTSLANFKDMDGHAFAAVYTDKSGRTFKCNLWVRMVTVTGVTIMTKNENEIDGVPASITVGTPITLGRSYVIDNLNGESKEKSQAEYNTIRDRMDERYYIEWTSTPKDAGTASNNIYEYTASIVGKKQAAEKKTFTVSMKDRKTKKVLFKNSCTITVTVNPTYDFDLVEGPWKEQDDNGQMWLCLKVKMPLEEYQKQKLTVVSEDTGVLSLTTNKTVLEQVKEPVKEPEGSEGSGETGETEESGKTEVIYTYVRIPCKNPKPGTAWIKITAPDEMKSTRRDCIEFIDKEPKVVGATAVTINKAMDDQTASVTVRTQEDWPLDIDSISTDSLLLNKKATESLQVQAEPVSQEEGSGYCDYKITFSLTEQAAADKNVKNGKNAVALKLTVKPKNAESKEKPEQYTLNLTVNVTNTKPSVTFKQTGKVNLFYNDAEGYGVLTVNANGAQLQNLRLEDYEDKNPKKNAACDFELKEGTESGIYYIALKENGNAKNKKGLLKYEIEGYTGIFQSTFTVASETKKPTIVLSGKSDSLYPNLGYSDSWLTMTNKATGEYIEAASARYVVNKKKNQYTSLDVSEFSDQNDPGKLIEGNNRFRLLVTPDGNIVSRLQGTDAENPSYSKKADKFNLEIKEANWNDWIAVSYSVKVETSKPKIAFGASTLTLNKNSAVYRAQMARTSLRLKGCSNNVMQDAWNWVSITGQDEKSKKALKVDNSLVLQYWNDCGDIVVKFNNNKIDTGSYKFKITVGNDEVGTIASSVLTVKVVDTSMDKNLKVTAKGSIDVLDREGTYITYTPKLSNLTGVITNGWLEGRDADLFDAWMEDGKLIVHARDGETYSTKYSYQVNAVFWVQTQDYDGCEISTAKPLTIKLKQGKPKLKATTVNNTLYRQLDNTVEIKLDATLNKKEVEIEDVWLLNYMEDLELRTSKIQADNTDDSGEQYYDVIYNPETKSVTLAWRDRNYANSIVQSGKTWKVKLAVRYRDKAGNEKNGEVTCPVVVR